MKPIYWLLILPLAFFAGQVFIPIQALWPFFLLPFLWAFPASAWAGRSWSARVDVPRGLGLGLLAAVISCAWISHFSLLGGRFVAPDFSRYCGNLAVVMDGEWWAWHEASSLLPAWILSPIAGQVGLMDALAWGALLGFGVTAAACYWWASVLHSRLAGIAAVLFCLCMMPLVVMSRSLTFYPLHVAVFTLATATATVALVRKTKGALLMAGVAIGLALLMDVRGLLFALPAFGAAVLASYKRPLWRTFFRLLLVLAPLTASWHMADRAYPDPSVSLEEQILNLGPYRKARAALGVDAVHDPETRYTWGQSSLFEIPATLNELRLQVKSISSFTKELPANKEGVSIYLVPWIWPAFLALVLAIWGLRRDRWRLLALGLSLLPALAGLRSVLLVEVNLRFLTAVAPCLAVLLGIAFASLVQLPSVWEGEAEPKGPGSWSRWARREPLALVALMGLIFGILPSWLSPLSARNPPMEMNQLGRAVEHFSNAQWSENELLLRIEFDRIANHLGQPDSDSLAVCEERLFKDLLAGQDLGVSVFR